jgi:hypothetical protein
MAYHLEVTSSLLLEISTGENEVTTSLLVTACLTGDEAYWRGIPA